MNAHADFLRLTRVHFSAMVTLSACLYASVALCEDLRTTEPHLSPVPPGGEEVFFSNREGDVIFVADKLEAFEDLRAAFMCVCVTALPDPPLLEQETAVMQASTISWKLKPYVTSLERAQAECAANSDRFVHRRSYNRMLRNAKGKERPPVVAKDEVPYFAMNFPIFGCRAMPVYRKKESAN